MFKLFTSKNEDKDSKAIETAAIVPCLEDIMSQLTAFKVYHEQAAKEYEERGDYEKKKTHLALAYSAMSSEASIRGYSYLVRTYAALRAI